MDTIESILTRRSIRKFTGEPVAEEQLHTILRTGFSAPSAKNTRPWQLLVIRNPQTLQAITKVHPFSSMLPEAGCGVLICGDATANDNQGYLLQDCSAAMENMLLAAHALGLGAVWLGVAPREERIAALRELLSIPEHSHPMALMALGHPAEERPAPDRYDAAKVFYERWGAKEDI